MTRSGNAGVEVPEIDKSPHGVEEPMPILGTSLLKREKVNVEPEYVSLGAADPAEPPKPSGPYNEKAVPAEV